MSAMEPYTLCVRISETLTFSLLYYAIIDSADWNFHRSCFSYPLICGGWEKLGQKIQSFRKWLSVDLLQNPFRGKFLSHFINFQHILLNKNTIYPLEKAFCVFFLPWYPPFSKYIFSMAMRAFQKNGIVTHSVKNVSLFQGLCFSWINSI